MNHMVFDFENENGFFCLFFFFLETYIYCCKNNKLMYIKDDKWKFKYEKGLDDYFELNNNVKKYTSDLHEATIFTHMNVPDIHLTIKGLYKIFKGIVHN